MRKTTLVAAILAATVASANAAPVSERLARGASQSTKSADVRNSTSSTKSTSERSVNANVPAKAAQPLVAPGAAAFTSARSAGSPSKGGGAPARVAAPVPTQAAAAAAGAERTRTISRKAVRQARAREAAKMRQAANVGRVSRSREAAKSREARRAAALAAKSDTVALERDVELPDAPKPGAEAANLPTGSIPSMVTAMARAQGVSPALAHAVVKVESRYRPNATGRGGYIGLMQLSYQTARGMGFRGSRQALYEPRNNLTYGMKYLAGAVAKSGGNTCAAVSKYQGGHGVRGVTRAGAVYCAKVKRFMAEGVPASGRRTADASAPQPRS